eukprot:240401-Chlamydomonas_euryale.AAC.8
MSAGTCRCACVCEGEVGKLPVIDTRRMSAGICWQWNVGWDIHRTGNRCTGGVPATSNCRGMQVQPAIRGKGTESNTH